MLAIEVRFLTGRFVAASHHDRNVPEWPPHPARLFSALVATWADADQPDSSERQALEWLESQISPSIYASDATPRSQATHFVPVNDARIFSQSSYDNRARQIKTLLAQIESARAQGESGRKIKSLETKVKNQQNVSQMVASVGNTPVKSAVDILPPGWISTDDHIRTGQARSYPSVTPDESRIVYLWDGDLSNDTSQVLDGLCARVTRLGHSSSFVSLRILENPPPPNHVPGSGADVLRSVRAGQLVALEREHAKHQGSRPRTLPFTSVRYRKVTPACAEAPTPNADTVGEWLVLSFMPGSRRFPSTRAVHIATALRGAVLSHATDPIPEGLSGHQPLGSPSTHPHIAFLPLPWVGHQYSDGRLMGAAIAIPESLDSESQRALFRAVGRWEVAQEPLIITLGPSGVLKMERIVGTTTLVTLRHSLWSRQSRRWVSATPIALPAHPGALSSGTVTARAKAWARAERAVVDSCRHIGLPKPEDVSVSLAPLLTGARPAPAFPSFRQPGRGGRPVARRLLHASVTFKQEVSGPIVLGAGRYLGLGLMRPMTDQEPNNE